MSSKRARVASRSRCAIEPLESRVLLAGDVRFAVLGAYSAGPAEQSVANLVKSWNPGFIVTTGDNNYPSGAAATLDANVGQYFHQFIAPYKGTYGPGPADGLNHFWPSLGDHDWNTANAQPYLSYFTLPGNGRYYDFQQGNVGIFVLDGDPREPDGNTPTSVQGQWLQHELARSTAQWKIVISPFAPYSSGAIGDTPAMQWPFKQWGATAVISGHDHDYERITSGGLTYFVDALGGQGRFGFDSPIPGSQVRFADDYGAMLVEAGASQVRVRFVTVDGTVIDDYTSGANAPPAAPSTLVAQALSSSQVGLTWSDPANDETGFTILRSTDGVHFSPIASAPIGLTTFADKGLSPGGTYFYHVVATNDAGSSTGFASAIVNLPAASNGIAFLSDLSWSSASNDFGPVKLDRSNGGRDPAEGHTITLNGVPYVKGLGVHAASSIVYNLGGQYARFLADVGVDDEETIHGQAIFQVLADGQQIYDSGLMSFDSPTQHVALNVSGVQQLALLVQPGGDTIDYDHADWAGARLAVAGAIPAAPPPPTIAPTGGMLVHLAWQQPPAGVDQILVERSTDGVNFIPLTTVSAAAASYDDATAGPQQTYFYRLRSVTLAGTSAPSAPVSVSTPPQAFVFNHGIVGIRGVTLSARSLADGSVLSGGPIRLARGATIRGNAAGVSVLGGTITGASGTPSAKLNYAQPASPQSTSNDKAARYLKRGQFRLAAGQNATLPAGTYVFHDVVLGAGATLNVSGMVVIYVTGSVTLGRSAALGDGTPADLRLAILGPGKVTLGPASSTAADVYAPLARITLAAGSALTGSVIGNTLSLGSSAAVHDDPGLGPDDVSPIPLPLKKAHRARPH